MTALVIETDLTITRDGQVIADVIPRDEKYRLWITSRLLRDDPEAELDEMSAENDLLRDKIRDLEICGDCDQCDDTRDIIRSDKADSEKIAALRELLMMEAA